MFVEGKLVNTGSATGPVNLEVRYYGKDGRPVGEDNLRIGAIGAGATTEFRGPAHPPGAISGFSLYLNHGRNPYGD